MILYKIVRMVGNHGVSVFPTEETVMPPAEQIMGEPVLDHVRKLVFLGYSEHDAYWIVQAWAYTAKYELNQDARGIRVFMEMCLKKAPIHVEFPPDPRWHFAALVALVAAVALALVLWVYFDKEYGLTFAGHPWAYVMRYGENLWQAEILYVTPEQTPVYEIGGDFGPVLMWHDRNATFLKRPLDILGLGGRLVLRGRRLLFWHEYQWTWFEAFFCGVLTHITAERYQLREHGHDPYKPVGPWWRPGGLWGTPEYAGCWQEFWWL